MQNREDDSQSALLFKFLLKRVALLAGVAILAAFFLDSGNPRIPVGILLGGLVSIYKTRLFGRFLDSLVTAEMKSGTKPVLFQLLSQLLMLVLLIISVLTDLRLFIGVAAGLLLVPAVIFINAVTEKIGITRNVWKDLH